MDGAPIRQILEEASGSSDSDFQVVINDGDSFILPADPARNGEHDDLQPCLNVSAGSSLVKDSVPDTTPPTLVSFPQGTSVVTAGTTSLRLQLVFSEPVFGVRFSSFVIEKTGTADYDWPLIFWRKTPPSDYASVFWIMLSNPSGTGSITITPKPTDPGITDAAGNPYISTFSGKTFIIDRDPPSVTSVQVPNPHTFMEGENIDLAVEFSEPVHVTGSPFIDIHLDHGGPIRAYYSSGTGSNTIDFRSTIGPNQADITGVDVNPTIDLNGGVIRDSSGNPASLALVNIADSSQVRVDSSPPTVSAPIPDQSLVVGGPPLTVDLSNHFTDLGSNSLDYSVDTNTAPAKASAIINGSNLTLNALANGVTQIAVKANDGHGGTVTDTFSLAVGTAEPTAGQIATTGVMNSQTSLFEITVNLTNTTALPINGFRLNVDFSAYLAAHPSLRLYNATLTTAPGIAHVDYPFPVAVDAGASMKLAFYTNTRLFPDPFSPILSVEKLASSQLPDTNGDGIQPRLVNLLNQTKFIEFPSIPGRWYRVRYSHDLVHWQDCPVPLQAGTNRMQWIDNGPPFTESPPSAVPQRFYIVNEITAP